MLVVETIARIRREHFIKGKTIKENARDLKVSRNTVRKVLRSGETSFEYERLVQPRKQRGKTPKSVETNLPARPDLTKIQPPPTKTAKLKAADVSLTRGSNESRAVRFQSRHNAVANRPRVRNRPSRCAAGSGA